MNKIFDPVTRPEHYNQGETECIDAIRSALTPEEFRGYCKGNAVKYIWRELFKNGTEDIAKAQFYLEKLGCSLKENSQHQLEKIDTLGTPPASSNYSLLKMFADGTKLSHRGMVQLLEVGLIQSIDSGAASAITDKGRNMLNGLNANHSDRQLISMFAKGTKMTTAQLQRLVAVNLIYPDHNGGKYNLTSAGSYLLKEFAK